MNQLAESNHTPAPIEVFTETLRDLEMELDEAINSGHGHIVVVTYPETGIQEWLQANYAHTGYSFDSWLEAYITLTITPGPIEEKRITILSPYQYKTLRGNTAQLGKAEVILATLHPSRAREDELEEIVEAYIGKAIHKEKCGDRKSRIVRRARKHKTKIRVNGRELDTLLPAYTAKTYCHMKPIDRMIDKLKEKLAKLAENIHPLLKTAPEALAPIIGRECLHAIQIAGHPLPGAAPIAITAVVIDYVIEKTVTRREYRELQESITHLPYHILEQKEEEENLPPGTLTMLTPKYNPANILARILGKLGLNNQQTQQAPQELEHKLEQEKNHIQTAIQELTETLETLRKNQRQLEARVRRIEETLRHLQTRTPWFSIIEINSIEELIQQINYKPYHGELVDLRNQSRKLETTIQEILDRAKKGAVVITGPSGSGKTTLLTLTAKTTLEKGGGILLLKRGGGYGAKNISEIPKEELADTLILFDNLETGDTGILRYIIDSRKTLPLIATARNYILEELIEKIKQETKGVDYQTETRDFLENHTLNLGLIEEYPEKLLRTLLKKEGIRYEEEAIKILVENSKQQYTTPGKTSGASNNIYYIIKTIEWLQRKHQPLTKKTAKEIPVSLYELLAEEIIHAVGLEEMARLVEAKGESALDELYLNPNLASEFTPCITRHPDNENPKKAFAHCYIAYISRLTALALNDGKPCPPIIQSLVKTHKIPRCDDQTQTLCLPAKHYLNNELPHDSYKILLNPDPSDMETVKAQAGNKNWKLIRELTRLTLKIINADEGQLADTTTLAALAKHITDEAGDKCPK